MLSALISLPSTPPPAPPLPPPPPAVLHQNKHINHNQQPDANTGMLANPCDSDVCNHDDDRLQPDEAANRHDASALGWESSPSCGQQTPNSLDGTMQALDGLTAKLVKQLINEFKRITQRNNFLEFGALNHKIERLESENLRLHAIAKEQDQNLSPLVTTAATTSDDTQLQSFDSCSSRWDDLATVKDHSVHKLSSNHDQSTMASASFRSTNNLIMTIQQLTRELQGDAPSIREPTQQTIFGQFGAPPSEVSQGSEAVQKCPPIEKELPLDEVLHCLLRTCQQMQHDQKERDFQFFQLQQQHSEQLHELKQQHQLVFEQLQHNSSSTSQTNQFSAISKHFTPLWTLVTSWCCSATFVSWLKVMLFVVWSVLLWKIASQPCAIYYGIVPH